MKLPRRDFLHLVAGAGALPFAPHRKPARRPDFLAARPGNSLLCVLAPGVSSRRWLGARVIEDSRAPARGVESIRERRWLPGTYGSVSRSCRTLHY
jgi:hypothetical protein